MDKQKIELLREYTNSIIGLGEITTDLGSFFQLKDFTDSARNVIVNFSLEGRIVSIKLGEFEPGNEVIILERDFKGKFYVYSKNLKNLLPNHEGVYYYYDYYHEITENNLEIAETLINQVIEFISKLYQFEFAYNSSIDFINLKNNKKTSTISQEDLNVIKRIIKKYNWQGLLDEKNKVIEMYPSQCILPPEVRPDQNTNYSILHITEGCWRRNSKLGPCKFCGTYNNVEYKEKGFKQLAQHLIGVKKFIGNGWDTVGKVFLLDADPLNTKINSIEYLKYIQEKNPNLKWFECFVSTKTILSKSINEWKKLVEFGLRKVYWGVESADDNTLKIIGKNQNQMSLYMAAERLREINLCLVVIIMSGVGNLDDSSHVKETVKFITDTECTDVYVSKFTLQKNTKLYDYFKLDKFILLSDEEAELQHREMIKKINLNKSIEIKGGYGQQFI